jgi:Ca-activated chloride channel family protein
MPFAFKRSLIAAASSVAMIALLAAAPALAGKLSVEAGLGQSKIEAKPGQTLHLRINLKALVGAGSEVRRSPVNVSLVLDKSGSMKGDRIAAAKEAARLALERLSPDDRVSVVTFNHLVDVLLPSGHLRDQSAVREKIDAIRVDGTTAIYAGVSEGGRQVQSKFDPRRVNRVILMSDGQANVGPASPKELGELGRQLASKGITVTTIGLGLDYNEDLMQRLASASDGNHAFAKTPADLVKFFNYEFGDAQSVTAQDIEIDIEVEAGFRPKRVLSREADIRGQRVTVKLNAMQADNERYVIVELEATERPAIGPRRVASANVRYVDIDTGARSEVRADVEVAVTDRSAEAEASLDKTIAAQVATQIAVEDSRRAVELRDGGDIAGARRLLSATTASVGALREKAAKAAPGAPAASPKALSDLEALEAKSKAAAENLDDAKWSASRKSMRHDQNTYGTQSKY